MADGDGEGFRIAGAFVEVGLKDNTPADERRIRARIEGEDALKWDTVLKDPDNTEIVRRKIEDARPVKMAADLDDKLAQAKAAEFLAQRRTAVIDLDANIATLRGKLEELTAKKGTSVEVDADIRKAEAQLAELVARRRRMQIEVEAKTQPAEEAMSRLVLRGNREFGALKLGVFSAGLPLAATAGAAGAAAALGLVGTAAGVMVVSVVSANERVQDSFRQTTSQVQTNVKAMAQPLEGDVVDAVNALGESWQTIAPAVQTAARGSAPAIRELTGAATDFAENAMPGVVDAVEASEKPLQGLRSLSAQTAHGLSEFLTDVSKNGDEAKDTLRDLGGVTEDLLDQSGDLITNLAHGAHDVVPQFGGALHQVLEVADTLTSDGMPLLTGTTSGFLGTVGGGLNIVNGMASALGSWAAPLGDVGGSLLATNTIAKVFGTSIGETGGGVRAFSTVMDEAGNKTTPFKQAMDGVEGKGNKLRAGLKSVVDGGFNPLGLALVAGGFLLDQWGESSQQAAAKAAEFGAAVADIKGTLSSTGAVTANTRALEANNLATKKLGVSQHTGSQLLAEYGVSSQIATDAMTGSAGALDRLNDQMDMNVRATLAGKLTQSDWQALQDNGISKTDAYAAALGGAVAGYKNLDDAVKGTSGSTDENLNRLNSALGAIQSYTQGQRDLVTEVKEQARATAEAQRQLRELGDATGFAGEKLRLSAADSAVMSGALATLGDATKNVADQGNALGVVLDQLSGKNNTLSAAQAASTKSFDDADKYIKQVHDSGGKLKGTFNELVNGEGGINGLTAKGASLQGVFGALSQTMGSEVAATFAQSQATGDSLATSMGRVGEVVGRTRQKFIDAAVAAGLTKTQAGELADRLGLIPGEVEVQFAAKGDQQLQDKLLGIQADLKKVPDKKGIQVDSLTQPAVDALQQLGEQVVQLPDGTFRVFANTAEGRDAAEKLRNEIIHYDPVVVVHANTNDATGSVTQWQQRTNGTWGMTTTDTRTDPATGKVQAWMMQANGTMGWTTLNTRSDPANGQLQGWVQKANGTWAWVNLNANTAAAEAAINYVARDRTGRITMIVRTDGSVRVGNNNIMNALGGLYGPSVGFANGGFPEPTEANRFRGAEKVMPGTFKWAGDARVPEVFIPLQPTSARSQDLLDETLAVMRPGAARGGGPATVTNNIDVTVHTMVQEPAAAGAAVAGALAWQMRGG